MGKGIIASVILVFGIFHCFSQDIKNTSPEIQYIENQLIINSFNRYEQRGQLVDVLQEGARNRTSIEQISEGLEYYSIVRISQQGYDNVIDIESFGGNHNMAVQQLGNLNSINQQIKNSFFNNSSVVQKGNGNTGNLLIDGNFNELRVETKGNDNSVGSTKEIAIEGDYMRTWIQQLGDYNAVDAYQEGDLQQVSIRQKGDFNVLSLEQKSHQKDINGNAVYLEQNGSTNSMRVKQGGSSSNMFVLQQGARNQMELELMEDKLKGAVSQLGDQNLLLQKISGRGQEYEIIQEGNNNLLIQNDNREQPQFYSIHQKGNGMKLILENTQMVTR